MSRLRSLLIAVMVASASAAQGGVTTSDLSAVGVAPLANAQIPIDAIWHDEFGRDIRLADALHKRPSVLIFADFTCTTLCGSIVSVAAELLTHTGLKPGRDFALVILGLNAKEGAADALAFKQQIADGAVASATKMLSASEVHIKEAAEAVGYRFAYDAERNQYAHPAALLILTADGYVARVLAGLGLSANDLGLALLEAGQGHVGTLGDRVRLMCYGFDPSLGIYTPLIQRSLIIGSGVSLLVLAGLLLHLSRRASH